MTHPDDRVRDAIQSAILDAAGDGWTLGQYVICMGLQRLSPDGEVESTPWYWAPRGQPVWQTQGLMECGRDMLVIPPFGDDEDD